MQQNVFSFKHDGYQNYLLLQLDQNILHTMSAICIGKKPLTVKNELT